MSPVSDVGEIASPLDQSVHSHSSCNAARQLSYNDPAFSIVVAHYHENLNWLNDFRSEVLVYCKGQWAYPSILILRALQSNLSFMQATRAAYAHNNSRQLSIYQILAGNVTHSYIILLKITSGWPKLLCLSKEISTLRILDCGGRIPRPVWSK